MDFFTVFSAVFLAEVCKMIFERYFKGWLDKTFDKADKIKEAAFNGSGMKYNYRSPQEDGNVERSAGKYLR